MARQPLYPHVPDMPRREPLYPHIPKSRKIDLATPNQEVKLRFLPDSPEFIAQTINGTGYQPQLERVVREAIARVNRR